MKLARPTTAPWSSLALVLNALAVTAAAAATASSQQLLVVSDSKDGGEAGYSKFWNSLRARGYELSFRDARDTSPSSELLLTKYDEKQYEGLILFAPSMKSLPPDLSPQAVYSFLTTISPNTAPGNVLVGLSPSLSENYRDFAREFSIEFDERDTTLYDPTSASVSSSTNGEYVVDVSTGLTFSSSPNLESHGAVVSLSTKRSSLPIRYSGLVHQATDLPLLFPLLRAPPTAFPIEVRPASSNEISPVEGGPLITGETAKLVSAFQTRVNSRIVWSGSLDLFNDKHWIDGQTSNQAFVEDVTRWVFGEKGVLKVLESRHYPTKAPQEGAKELYRIGEEMTYEIVLSVYEDGRWIAPSTLHDLQLEVTMLDPHLRIPLIPSTAFAHRSNTNRTYVASMRLPDRHGVFTLLTDYRRQGLSWIEDRKQISITPLRHDEYPRFIKGAWPYYVTAGSMVTAWIAFVAIWLSIKEEHGVDKKTKGIKIQ